MSLHFNLCSSLKKVFSFSKNYNCQQPTFLTLNLGLSHVRFSLMFARFHFPGEPCLHRYVCLLEDYWGVCICSEFKHTVVFFFPLHWWKISFSKLTGYPNHLNVILKLFNSFNRGTQWQYLSSFFLYICPA